jgi:two-component system, OmpR family, sensor histidine kinase KdpD
VNDGDGRPAGTGLGLSVAKGVIEAMGGTIRAESPTDAGHGTRLLVQLPAAVPISQPEPDAKGLTHAGI